MLDAPESETNAGVSSPASARPKFADALRDTTISLAELAQYLRYYLSAQVDQIRLSVRSFAMYAVIGVLGVAAAATVLAVSMVLLMVGLAHGLGSALGGRDWLGDILVALIVLGGVAYAIVFGMTKIKTASRRGTERKYEDRRKKQREQFGRDIADRSAEH